MGANLHALQCTRPTRGRCAQKATFASEDGPSNTMMLDPVDRFIALMLDRGYIATRAHGAVCLGSVSVGVHWIRRAAEIQRGAGLERLANATVRGMRAKPLTDPPSKS